MTMEEVADLPNLRSAFQRVASNDGAPGPDQQSVQQVQRHLDTLLPKLRTELLEGHYQPGQIRRVWIPKAGGGQRGLGIPNVIDRLIQQAVHQVLSPHFEPRFHDSSHGFRPGRSCHTAIAEAKGYVEQGLDWLVDIDLAKFFDRVHHQRLLARLERGGVKDRRLLRLIRLMLKAEVVMPDGVVVSTDEGTPQGGPLSPLLSNIVLDELDQELHRRGHRFVRYADDCNIYVRSERSGHRVMASISRFIEKRLRLEVNQQKSAVARPEERHFLGFSLRRNPLDGDVEIRLSKRTTDRLAQKIRELTPRNSGTSLDTRIRRVNRYVNGWIAFFYICSAAERSRLHFTDSHLRRRLRAMILKQKKKKRHLVRFLVRHGVKRPTARKTVYGGRRSTWKLSLTPAAHQALRNRFFEERGLVSLEKQWLSLQPDVNAPDQLRLDLS
jgi:group II intron reverse transcriptase/maturase